MEVYVPANTEKPCPYCNGEGRILVKKYHKDCKVCKGTGTLKEVERLY